MPKRGGAGFGKPRAPPPLCFIPKKIRDSDFETPNYEQINALRDPIARELALIETMNAYLRHREVELGMAPHQLGEWHSENLYYLEEDGKTYCLDMNDQFRRMLLDVGFINIFTGKKLSSQNTLNYINAYEKKNGPRASKRILYILVVQDYPEIFRQWFEEKKPKLPDDFLLTVIHEKADKILEEILKNKAKYGIQTNKHINEAGILWEALSPPRNESQKKMSILLLNQPGIEVSSDNIFTGMNAVHYGTSYPEALKIIIQKLKANGKLDRLINAKDQHGETPLITAVRFGDPVESVKILLQNGADKSIKNKDGKTAYDICAGKVPHCQAMNDLQ